VITHSRAVSTAKAPPLAVTGRRATFTVLTTTWKATATSTLPWAWLTSQVSWKVRPG
jgi:hypothetical protein